MINTDQTVLLKTGST